MRARAPAATSAPPMPPARCAPDRRHAPPASTLLAENAAQPPAHAPQQVVQDPPRLLLEVTAMDGAHLPGNVVPFLEVLRVGRATVDRPQVRHAAECYVLERRGQQELLGGKRR